ncbi:MAG TPA: hypothetical protein VGM23_03375 [Armatimonadota bacterium]
MHTSRYTVRPDHPEQITLHADARYTAERAGRAVEVMTDCLTTSDAEAFHHTVEITITMDGQPYFTKQWARSVPRRLM